MSVIVAFLDKNYLWKLGTAQKMTFSIKDFFSQCDQICKKLRIWSHLLKESLMESFIFCAVRGCDFAGQRRENDIKLLIHHMLV